jgi:hypothetical protein
MLWRYATGPVWETDEQYLALLREALPEQSRVLRTGGLLQVRPFKSARSAVKVLAQEFGFEYVGMRKTTDAVKRDWLVFRKVADLDD